MIQHNFYPRSPCGERPKCSSILSQQRIISIHALLAESDSESLMGSVKLDGFLSTLSLRRATWKRFPPMCTIKHFYPRSPCGERLYLVRDQRPNWEISIHALLAESDILGNVVAGLHMLFLSTLSLRRATSKLKPPVKTHREFLSTLSLRRATASLT